MSRWPETWGRVKTCGLDELEDPCEYELSWHRFTDPPESGKYGYGSEGSVVPDTVAFTAHDEAVALCDAAHLTIWNYGYADIEYYFALRLREVLDASAWRGTSLGEFSPPRVVYAEDKFHCLVYHRAGRGDDDSRLSFCGDWADLEFEFSEVVPLPPGAALPPSSKALAEAVKANDLPRVDALLAAGAPVLPTDRLDGLFCSPGGFLRDGDPLWQAATRDVDPAVLDRILQTGHPPDRRANCHVMTPLQGAVQFGKAAQVEVLLSRGADPRHTYKELDAVAMAERRGDDAILALLRDWKPPSGDG